MTDSMALIDLVACPRCQSAFAAGVDVWRCTRCGNTVKLQEGKPVFTELKEQVGTFERVERGPENGTPWRRANWRFLQAEANTLSADALILDVGAGHGDFAPIFSGKTYISLDVVPYPEVALVCDLTQLVPFRPNTFDLVVLMNVLEHVYEYWKLLRALALILKPGGRLLIAVPFMVKIHQSPSDFHRFTHHALERLAAEMGLNVLSLEGYFDPLSLLGEGFSNLNFRVFPKLGRPQRLIGRFLLMLIQGISWLNARVVGKGYLGTPNDTSPAATGYHLILTKPL
jgi:SAM-dependent methyltransferase